MNFTVFTLISQDDCLAHPCLHFIMYTNRWVKKLYMHNSGILIHVHHLETAGWEDLLFGNPENDQFGSLATVVYLLLTAPDTAHLSTIIIGCGPSTRDNMSEAAYTKHTMLQHFDRLDEFPRLKPLLDALTPVERTNLRAKLENILLTPLLKNTADEVRMGAQMFTDHNVTSVYEICAASHAPRCAQLQANARANGLIPSSQLWMIVPTQMCFVDTVPDDTVVLEPAHRGDDPVLESEYTLPKALKPVVRMPADVKEELAEMITQFIADHTPSLLLKQ
jgi:hypothetical protein